MSTKDKGAVVKKGGGVLRVVPVNDNGGIADPESVTWVDLGYIAESNLQDETTTEDYHDERGHNINNEETVRTPKLTGLLMQSDKSTLDFLKETVRGNYYFVYQYQGIVNGKYQEVFYGICKIKPVVGLASGTKRPPFEITPLNNEYPVVSLAESECQKWVSEDSISSSTYMYVTDSDGSRLYLTDSDAGGAGTLGTTAPTGLSGTITNGNVDMTFVGYFVPTDTTNAYVADDTLVTIAANEYYNLVETATS